MYCIHPCMHCFPPLTTDCPVSLNLIDGSDYFEEAPTRPGDDSKGPSRHRNAFPANRF